MFCILGYKLSDEEVLQFAMQTGTIDITCMREQIEMKQREEILRKHTHKIWEGKDGYWHSYVYDETKPKNRKPIKKKQLKDLEDLIIEYNKKQVEENCKNEVKKPDVTLREIYPDWLQYKSLHTKATSYIKRITSDWKKYYLDDSIIDIPIKDFTKISLEKWALTKVKNLELTKKQYMNMSLIIRGCLSMAAEEKVVIKENLYLQVHINPKLFRPTKKKESKTQVYTEEEQRLIFKEAMEDFQNDPTDTTPLAVMLAFFIGTRPGETVAIKESDIHGDIIDIQRMESGVFETQDGINYSRVAVEVVDYTKTEAGTRQVSVSADGMAIIEIIKTVNESNGTSGGYLFNRDGVPVKESAIAWRVQKYCNHLEIKYRSPHKIRKTYISALIDGGVNIDTIRRLVGHTDERTTYKSYCYDRKEDKEIKEQLNDALHVSGLEIHLGNVSAA